MTTATPIRRPRARNRAEPKAGAPLAAGSWIELRVLSEHYADVQDVRKALNNQIRSGGMAKAVLDDTAVIYKDREKKISRELVKCLKRTAPSGALAWAEATPGIGLHLLGRLLGATGDPRLATPYHWEGEGKDNRVLVADEPYRRGAGQWWQYCGHGEAAKRRAGMSREEAMRLGNPRAKMLTHLLAESCLKAGGYRELYDSTKAHYLERELTKGHAHNCALRKMGKQILLELYLASEPRSEPIGSAKPREQPAGLIYRGGGLGSRPV